MTQPGADYAGAGPQDSEPTPDAQNADAQSTTAQAAGAQDTGAAGTDQVPADPAATAEQAQIAELTEALQRERAQFVNFRRRSAEEFASAAAGGKQRLMDKLLPLLDDLDRAREHGDLVEGPLKVFADKLGDILAGEQLVKFGAPGDQFDPELHEAIQNEGSGVEPVIGTVYRPGYRLGDKVIRHAMVTVTDPAPSAGDAQSASEPQ